jgi:prepilin-type N-terminal cleavage/methylation domain-containing protein/prepilin-type processing-associated H-X9-DG protein
MRVRRGFTLIELLVVIAIIGILAAMLFPVFARARESARKIQCLSNIKNIAMATQMYLTDYDKLWPSERRSEVINWYLDTFAPGWPGNTCAVDAPSKMNPYLKPPLILDEYIRNREVWSCPSARSSGSYSILNPYGRDWFAVDVALGGQGVMDAGFAQCSGGPYPPGWGGDITDSVRQGTSAEGPGAFHNSINVNSVRDISTSQMVDVSRYVVVGEVPVGLPFSVPSEVAYPDAFAMCGASPDSIACCGGNWVDWANCAWSRDCGADKHLNFADPQIRKTYGKPRHLGGANLGFADGHAKWFNSEAILNNSPDDPSRQWVFCCYGDPAAWDARQKRQGLFLGFMNGICQFWGDFGLPHYPG